MEDFLVLSETISGSHAPSERVVGQRLHLCRGERLRNLTELSALPLSSQSSLNQASSVCAVRLASREPYEQEQSDMARFTHNGRNLVGDAGCGVYLQRLAWPRSALPGIFRRGFNSLWLSAGKRTDLKAS
jgi:hypothetical protein